MCHNRCMRYEEIKDRNDKDFKRLTGVEPQIFQQMVTVLENELPNFGRPPKLSRADQLLMTLMYWREYRTQFHIAGSYGISEASVCRTINKQENFVCQARKCFSQVTHSLKLFWLMLASKRLNVRKKAKTLLQRQKEATYSKSTSNYSSKYDGNHRNRIWDWQST